MRTGRKVELMVASHNQESIEKAIKIMDEVEIDPSSSTICFAQLYGMSDNLTYNLGQKGFRAYKYVPCKFCCWCFYGYTQMYFYEIAFTF